MPQAGGGVASESDAVRALVLGVRKPAQWDRLAAVWQGVQTDFGLPAPAIAVSGTDGHWLWFSLAEAVPSARAAAFVAGLRARYLAELPMERTVLMPSITQGEPDSGCWQPADHLPCREVLPGQWSAFVAADLARIFEDEPWLDRVPNPNAQADVLTRLVPTPMADFERALGRLAPPAPADSAPSPHSLVVAAGPGDSSSPASPDVAPPHAAPSHAAPSSPGSPGGPRAFLRQLMNDPQVDLPLRIASAKALLPWTID
jgi:hypothetical protein